MPDAFGIQKRLSPLLQRFGLGGGAGEARTTTSIVPDTIRDPNLSTDVPVSGGVPVANNVPFSASNVSLGGEVARAVDRVKQLLKSGFLDPVTKRDAGLALSNLASLSSTDRAIAVEALGADLLTKLESKLSSEDRRKYGAALAEIRTARNAPINPPDRDAFLAEANRTLRGILELTWVNADQARALIDGLRRFDAKAQDAILDELGPGKVQWLTSGLSKIDREIYAPTVEVCRTAHFGAIARAEAANGLSPKDVTRRFFEILREVEAGTMKLTKEKHGGVTYLLVPGLATEHQPGYFEPNKERLEKRGLTVKISGIDTDADIQTNKERLSSEIRELSGGREDSVFVISHSKGGPDARSALQDAEIDKLAFFWDAMQSACGTPVSSTLMEGAGDAIERVFKDVFGAPNGKALEDLDYKTQKAMWIGTRPIETPILSLATTMGDAVSPLREIARIMKRRYGIESDGLVPFSEQLIGGKNAFSIVMDGLDHAAPVYRPLPGFTPKHDPADLQEARILLAYELKEGRV